MASYKAASKYFGDVAAAYDERRSKKDRWAREQEIVGTYVKTLPIGSMIADIPFGTGRFASFYVERELRVFGADISEDMIRIARQKLANVAGFQIEIAAAESLPLPDHAVDYLISHRFVKWLPDYGALSAVMKEFARVTRCEMLIQAKLEQKKQLSARSHIRRLLRKWLKPGAAHSRRFSMEEMASAIEENDFRIKSIAHCPEISDGVAYYLIERA